MMIFNLQRFVVLIIILQTVLSASSEKRFNKLDFFAKEEKEIFSNEVSIFETFVFFRYKSVGRDDSDDAEADGIFFIQDLITNYIKKKSNSESKDSKKNFLSSVYESLHGKIEVYQFNDLPTFVPFQGTRGDSYYYIVGVERSVIDLMVYSNLSTDDDILLDTLSKDKRDADNLRLFYYSIGAIDQSIAVENAMILSESHEFVNFQKVEITLSPEYYNNLKEFELGKRIISPNSFTAHPFKFNKLAHQKFSKNNFSGYINAKILSLPSNKDFIHFQEFLDKIKYKPLIDYVRVLKETKLIDFESTANDYLKFVLKSYGYANFKNDGNKRDLNYFKKAESLFQRQAPIAEIRGALQKSINHHVNHSETWNLLGVTFRIEERYWAAVSSFRQSLRLDPENPFPMANLAIAYKNLGYKSVSEPMALSAILNSEKGSWPYKTGVQILGL